jgi:ABC-type glycerol-3-phosphate transport system permease component
MSDQVAQERAARIPTAAPQEAGAADGRPRAPGGMPRSRRFLRRQIITTALMAVVAAIFLVPFYWLIISALRPADRIFAEAGNFFPSALTLENFASLFRDAPIVAWFINSVILAVGSTLGSMIVVTMAAYPLARIRFPFRNAIFVGILATQMLPFHLLLIPLFLLMVRVGLIDTHLGVILPLLAHPFGLFYMRQYMLGLPQEILDAARVDGASEYAVFFRVVLPMVKPALATLAILFSLESWNDLLWPLIVMRSEDNFPLPVGIQSQLGLYRPRWDLVMTASVIAVLPVVLLFLRMRHAFIGGLGQLGTGGK